MTVLLLEAQTEILKKKKKKRKKLLKAVIFGLSIKTQEDSA